MNFGKVDRFILFGGGFYLSEFALEIKNNNIDVIIFSSKRYLEEKIYDNITLEQILTNNKFIYFNSNDINSEQVVFKYISEKTIGLSLSAPWIFKKDLIEKFKGKLINLHGTRLPHYKGGGGFSWHILRDNRIGGGILHQIDIGIDTGNIIKYNEFYYPKSCRIPVEYEKISRKKIVVLLKEFLNDILNEKDFESNEQQESFSMYWPRLHTKTHGYIDWSWNVDDIDKFICASDDPYDGASTFIQNNRVLLKSAFSDYNDGSFHPFQSGLIYRKKTDSIFIAAIGGSLIINKVNDIDGNDIIAKLNIGDRLYTPIKYLENARSYRAIYTSDGLKEQ